MKNLMLLSIVVVLTLFSCSNSNIKISTTDSFQIIDLPDGSKAYLNKNSSLEYNKNFEQRVVTQNGEIFYSVAKGESPFIVKTNKGEIKVLGTEFNVKSSKDRLEVEVERGSVELKVNKLIKKVNKGQKVFFKEFKNGIKTSKAEFKHKNWIKNLNKELKNLSKEINKSSKHLKNDTKKIGKSLKKEFKKLNE